MAFPPQTFHKTLTSGLKYAGCVVLIAGVLFAIGEVVKPYNEQLPYSAFQAALQRGEIRSVRIGAKFLYGTRVVPTLPKAEAPFATIRVSDPHLTRALEAHGVPYAGQRENRLLTTVLPWFIPLGLLCFLGHRVLQRLHPDPGAVSFGKSRAKVHRRQFGDLTFDDVAGIDEAKQELREIVHFLRHPAKYARLGGRIPKGVLLVGPPGTGKTLLARAVAGEASAKFFSLSGADFVEMFVGVGAARVRDLFRQAQEHTPAIVFIDELDAVGKKRGANPVQHHDEREQTLNQLLTELDGFDTRDGVILLAATNRPEILDPALLRAGRFDRQVVVDRPDVEERLRILQLHARQVRLEPTVALDVVAARTPGMVGADLANVINEAALLAARHNKRAVTMDDLDLALDRIQAGPQKKSRLMAQAEKERVAYHESGHALVAAQLPTADPVRKVTIIPHGVAGLGYTQQLPTHDRSLYTDEALRDRITVLLGGRAAEALVYGQVSTGARDDLRQASDMARRMVMLFGMSSELGPYTVGQETHSAFLGDTDQLTRPASETTAQLIDREAQRLVEEMAGRAQQIVSSHRAALEALAQYLLEHESIDQESLTRLFADVAPRVTARDTSAG
jgi:cell division protease FtsH